MIRLISVADGVAYSCEYSSQPRMCRADCWERQTTSALCITVHLCWACQEYKAMTAVPEVGLEVVCAASNLEVASRTKSLLIDSYKRGGFPILMPTTCTAPRGLPCVAPGGLGGQGN